MDAHCTCSEESKCQPCKAQTPIWKAACVVVLLGLFAAFLLPDLIGMYDGMTLSQPTTVAAK